MIHQEKARVAKQIFSGGGEMGEVMRSYDWSQSPLGSVENWPQSLKTAVRITLTSRQPMFVWWGEQLINLYNDAYKDILGGKHPQAFAQPASEVWSEIWGQILPRAESALLDNEGTYDEALLLIMERHGYPEETYYTFSYSPVPDDQGNPGGIICANTNDTHRIITERQLALLRELAAKTSQARSIKEACVTTVKALKTNPYDCLFAIVYIVDLNQNRALLTASSGLENSQEATPETVELDQNCVWPLAEVVKSDKIALVSDLEKFVGNLPTGAWNCQSHQAVAVPFPIAGQTSKAGVLIIGLNPFRLFDDSYKGFIELISAQIAASIANAQAYEEERKRAESLAEIDRAKTVFFSNVSHEFRTPLTLMLSPLQEILAEADETPIGTQREMLLLTYRNGLRLQKLVNNLLDFSRIEAGRIQANYEPTDLATLTGELASVFRSLIEKAGINFKVECPPLPAPVYIDRQMWEKIVLNLLSNAFKFTFEGEISLSLTWLAQQVQLVVKDTGVGIPGSELPHLFERFHRVENSKGRTVEGSGIGLSLVQELVGLHSGKVEVMSNLAQGTSFTVTIPTGFAHLPPDRLSATPTQASTALGVDSYLEEASRWSQSEENITKVEHTQTETNTTFYLPPLTSDRILLADDNADMRDYVKRLLSQSYEVESVPDGLTALASIRQRRPDLVLTDVMMPGLDGFGLLKELRNDPNTSDLPIILLSARSGEESRIEGLDAGADDYLTKPFSARELLARIEANLKMAQLRQEAARREQELRLEAEAARDKVTQILESITDAFVFFDHQWQYVYVNEQAERLLQKTRQELLGKVVWEVFPDLIGTLTHQELNRALRDNVAVVFEDFSQSLQAWFEVHGYPSQNGFAVYFQDITESKETEARLKESQYLTQQIADTLPGILFIYDLLEKRNVYFNRQIWDVLGYTPEELQAMGANLIENLTHPDDLAKLLDYVESFESAPDGQMRALEYRHHNAEGDWRWLYTQSIVFNRTAEGKPKQILGFCIDITARKQAEENLQEQELFLQNITNNVPVLLWTAAVDGTMDFVSQPWIDYTGMDLTTVRQQGWQGLVHPDDLPETFSRWNQVQKSGSPYEMTHRLKHSNGDYRWCISRAVLTFDEQQNPLRWVGSAVDIQHQKQIESALRQSEEALRQNLGILSTINQATPTVIYVKDTQGRLTMGNPSLFSVFGKPESEVIGYTDLDLYLNSEDALVIMATDRQIMETGEMQIVEESLDLPEGRCTFLSAKSPYRNQQGDIIGLIGVSFDITARKQIEERIRESEQKLKLALETSKLGSWQIDLVTGVLECTNQFKANFGLPPEEDLSYQQLLRLIHPADATHVLQVIQDTIDNHQDYDVEYRSIWPDGSVHWIFARGKAIYSSDGRPLRLLGVTLDFTERKIIEKALRKSEEGLQLAIEGAQVGLWHWDLSTNTLTWTDQCKALFGLPADAQISYEVFLDLLHPEDLQRTHEAVNRCLHRRDVYDIEYRTIWPDGTIHWIAAKGSCNNDPDENQIRMMGVAIDITERKQTEEKLQQRAQELTAANEALAEASKILQDRNQELDQFVYVVSHDLKAPLRAISNLSEWIEDDIGDQLPPDNQQQMQLLRERVNRMVNLIDGLLDYSRFSRMETAKESVNVADLLAELIDSLDPPEGFTIELPPDLPILTTQRLPLSQVFANLISNAIKHHGSTHGKVTISAQNLPDYYKFTVADDGQGIPEEFHARVFAIFQTVTQSDSNTNTGIGLAIVKKIFEKHGGTISLESSPGEGTSFSFTWPK